ncbi:putative copper-transporting ATPase HMA5 [Camellia lanceoleosa]|uniref:Copper-transporting ATPase HMA5 n=1 Tax=Camellia lanceoleosa TaxID=1840588 RepID=A0ACC0G8L5_9ERIC|nr:putative copper-transporting ATPase HMA5 [Camellia lanceoleosa]
MDLTPDTTILLTLDNEGNVVCEEEIDSRLIQKNDVIKVIPGAKVASDGFVIWGQSHVNESMITGEARPVAKRKGDTVIGGTVNENGVLHIKATRVGSRVLFPKLFDLLNQRQMAKAPAEICRSHFQILCASFIILSFFTLFVWFLMESAMAIRNLGYLLPWIAFGLHCALAYRSWSLLAHVL